MEKNYGNSIEVKVADNWYTCWTVKTTEELEIKNVLPFNPGDSHGDDAVIEIINAEKQTEIPLNSPLAKRIIKEVEDELKRRDQEMRDAGGVPEYIEWFPW